MKEKRRLQDRHLPRIQDLVIMNMKRKRMTSKIELFSRRLITLLSTAVKPEQFIRK